MQLVFLANRIDSLIVVKQDLDIIVNLSDIKPTNMRLLDTVYFMFCFYCLNEKLSIAVDVNPAQRPDEMVAPAPAPLQQGSKRSGGQRPRIVARKESAPLVEQGSKRSGGQRPRIVARKESAPLVEQGSKRSGGQRPRIVARKESAPLVEGQSLEEMVAPAPAPLQQGSKRSGGQRPRIVARKESAPLVEGQSPEEMAAQAPAPLQQGSKRSAIQRPRIVARKESAPLVEQGSKRSAIQRPRIVSRKESAPLVEGQSLEEMVAPAPAPLQQGSKRSGEQRPRIVAKKTLVAQAMVKKKSAPLQGQRSKLARNSTGTPTQNLHGNPSAEDVTEMDIISHEMSTCSL
ncbi:hypothetical protein CTEN210_14905 [Chaetoceros tenuissimus]|uniref:Uncharacterized protein n=1 Tax=Chaetoceros tenuissimus TaxID=426638 RepID=A0AAD3HCS3_9STRA|nr:hypothetical protein CTEN210_14905 [Chaetoceros tenuissimus]